MLTLVTSPRFVEHSLPRELAERVGGHPERPERIRAIHAAMAEAGMLPSKYRQGSGPLEVSFELEREATGCTHQEVQEPVDSRVVGLIHPPDYIRRMERIAGAGGGFADAAETYLGPGSEEIARLAVAAGIAAADAVVAGPSTHAFALVRPPGHHAEPQRAMGFCIYSNLAIVAAHLRGSHGLGRLAIVDFDVHHGNGTIAAFYEDPDVLVISMHQEPRTLWPGTGLSNDTGAGRGRGATLNVPLPPGSGDPEYLAAFDEQVRPAIDRFAPEGLLVSAGFDAHRDDPLASMTMTESGFAALGGRLADLAGATRLGGLVAMLEGGYDLRALGRSAVAFARALARHTSRKPDR